MIKTRLKEAKGIWPNELSGVLWTYWMTTCTPIGETPFRLAFGSEAVTWHKLDLPATGYPTIMKRGMKGRSPTFGSCRRSQSNGKTANRSLLGPDGKTLQHQSKTSSFSGQGPSPNESNNGYQRPYIGQIEP